MMNRASKKQDELKSREDLFLAEGVRLAGDAEIRLGEQVNIWYHAVLRATGHPIVIGDRTNIQDGTVIHTSGHAGVTIGRDVTVGHCALIHGCTIGDETLIGMGSTVMNDAKIGSQVIIGAGSLVTERTEIPDGMLAFGRPAKVVRPLTEEEKAGLKKQAADYVKEAEEEKARCF